MRNVVVVFLFCLAACGQQTGEGTPVANGEDAASVASINIDPDAADIRKAADLVPASAELAAKYDRSCRACHATPDAAAPLTGHVAAWDARYAGKGSEGLLLSTKAGLNAMPAMGLCNDCTDEELLALTAFMAGRES